MSYSVRSRSGIKYLRNSNTTEVHDLNNEKPQCQIDKILGPGHTVGFSPDTREQAHSEGNDNGEHCIGAGLR